ncbi:hypothetical protein [Nesterenkonia ebinurensis]|uniref:hypothetical protein n=1 Tax=Nesterenkonia ebinurensis TaxID=2608252 RepID=UPI00123D1F71|nr:hypothetical protein [Nesterenkonia ebinurensis]
MSISASPRAAPFAPAVLVVDLSAIVMLSPLFGSIPLFAPVGAGFDLGPGANGLLQSSVGGAYAQGFGARRW